MKKFSKLVTVLGSTLFFLTAANASIPNNDSAFTSLGPTLKTNFITLVSDNVAGAVIGEAGANNFRFNATAGFIIAPNQRLKFTAEYLVQRLTYHFFSGNFGEWVNQGAVGAGYQYLFCDLPYDPAFDVNAYLAHAPTKYLNSRLSLFFAEDIPVGFVNARRVSGFNAGGIAPGVSLQLWPGNRVGLFLNYDDIRYSKNFWSNQSTQGLGGTVRFNQMLTHNFEFSGSAAFRQPFNAYTANVVHTNIPFFGNWEIGLFGDYTVGKNHIPDSYDLGIRADYYLDVCIFTSCPYPPVAKNALMAWTSDPSVYIPQVLNVAG